jgi:hypothetical protein
MSYGVVFFYLSNSLELSNSRTLSVASFFLQFPSSLFVGCQWAVEFEHTARPGAEGSAHSLAEFGAFTGCAPGGGGLSGRFVGQSSGVGHLPNLGEAQLAAVLRQEECHLLCDLSEFGCYRSEGGSVL